MCVYPTYSEIPTFIPDVWWTQTSCTESIQYLVGLSSLQILNRLHAKICVSALQMCKRGWKKTIFGEISNSITMRQSTPFVKAKKVTNLNDPSKDVLHGMFVVEDHIPKEKPNIALVFWCTTIINDLTKSWRLKRVCFRSGFTGRGEVGEGSLQRLQQAHQTCPEHDTEGPGRIRTGFHPTDQRCKYPSKLLYPLTYSDILHWGGQERDNGLQQQFFKNALLLSLSARHHTNPWPQSPSYQPKSPLKQRWYPYPYILCKDDFSHLI